MSPTTILTHENLQSSWSKLKDKKLKNVIEQELNNSFRKIIENAFDKNQKTLKKKILSSLSFKGNEKIALDDYLKDILKDGTIVEKNSLEKALKKLPVNNTIGEILQLESKINDNPFLNDIRESERKNKISRIAGKNKNKESLANSLLTIFGERYELIEACVNYMIGRKAISKTQDVVTLTTADWEDLIKSKKIPIAPYRNSNAFAKDISLMIEKEFPSAYLFYHMYDKVSKINSRNKKEFQKLKNKLHLLLTYDKKKVAETAKQVERSLEVIKKFGKLNPDIDLLKLNWRDELLAAKEKSKKKSKLKWTSIGKEDRKKICLQLLATQVNYKLTKNTENTDKLFSAGFYNARSVNQLTVNLLINKIGIAKNEALEILSAAKYVVLQAENRIYALSEEQNSPQMAMMLASSAMTAEINELSNLVGYNELFGKQDYCDCEHCKSIFGPAAYFVDLMKFIDSNITSYTPALPSTIQLRTRRPDLWDLELNCENTSKLIMHIEIVNEILASYISRRNANTDAYFLLSEGASSFRQPFNLPLIELRKYLQHFKIGINDVFEFTGNDEKQLNIAREILHISQEELSLITSPSSPISDARKYFGIDSLPGTDSYTVKEFLKYTGLTRKELNELATPVSSNRSELNLNFISGFTPNVFIDAVRTDDDDINSYTEYINGMDNNAFDLIHRFIRLKSKMSLTYRELGLAIKSFGGDIDDNLIIQLADFSKLKERFKLSIEEFCSIYSIIPNDSFRELQPGDEAEPGFFDRLFNPNIDGLLNDDILTYENNLELKNPLVENEKFLSNGGGQYDIKKLNRLIAGLGISFTQFTSLVIYLEDKGKLSFTDLISGETGNENNKFIDLDLSALSLLYRYSFLIKFTHWSVDDFLWTLQIIDEDGLLEGSEKFNQFLKFIELLNEWRLLPEDIYLLDESKIPLLVTEEILNDRVKQYYVDSNLVFNDDLLSELVRLNDDDDETLLRNRSFEIINRLRINECLIKFNISDEAGITLEKYTVKKLNLAESDIVNAIQDTSTSLHSDLKNNLELPGKILVVIQSFIREPNKNPLDIFFSVNELPELFTLRIMKPVPMSFNPGITGETTQLFIPGSTEIRDNVLPINRALALAKFSEVIKLTTSELAFLYDNPQFFKLLEGNFTVDFLKLVLQYKEIMNKVTTNLVIAEDIEREDRRNAIQELILDFEINKEINDTISVALRQSFWNIDSKLTPFLSLNKLPRESDGKIRLANILAELFQTDIHFIGSIMPFIQENIDLSLATQTYEVDEISQVIPILNSIIKISDLGKKLALDGSALRLLLLNSFDDLKMASSAVKETMRSRYTEARWKEIVKPFEEDLNELKRDALAGFILADKSLGFNNPNSDKYLDMNQLYSYFLIDVAMDSCYETSRIVAANSSLQLYVNRVLMNLERTDTRQATIKETARKEWEWRANYRIFEANRKVYLYPENYIEPELRDDKTFIFKELEDELLQKNITDQTAEISYRHYMDKFLEVANLDIVGSYYDTEPNAQTLYLIGRSRRAPFQFYIRTSEKDSVWTSWEKIEVGINSTYVTPIIIDGRLHLFWIEIPKKESTDDKRITHLCYTYKLFGKWNVVNKIEGVGETTIETPTLFKKNYDSIWIITEDDRYFLCYNQKKYPLSIDDNKVLPREIADTQSILRFGILPILPSGADDMFILKLSKTNLPLSLPMEFNAPLFTSQSISLGEVESYRISDKDSYVPILFNGRTIKYLPLIFNAGFYIGGGIFTVRTDSYLASAVIAANFTKNLNAVQISPTTTKTFLSKITTSLAPDLQESLYRYGVKGLLAEQYDLNEPFLSIINPAPNLQLNKQSIFDGAYGTYYWEIFFHIPFLIAHQLNANGKYEEAKKWYDHIFNPFVSKDTPSSDTTNDYKWRFVKFREINIPKLNEMLNDRQAIERYKKNPFNPHAVARFRISAYMKTIVMKYIDNLIDWADSLFGRDTREAIDVATMLYTIAQEILGPKPIKLGKCSSDEKLTFNDLVTRARDFNNSEFLFEIEREVEVVVSEGDEPSLAAPETPVELFYAFCIIPNQQLLDYWDRVEQQLFKIRHCMNIEGVVRQLPLFQPPIDPMLLVKAKAAGLSIADVVAGLYDKVPNYRFNYLIEKAKSYTSLVQSFGSALLTALEKKDVEDLQLLRSLHEQNILNLTTEVKKQQIKDADEQIKILQDNLDNVDFRFQYYSTLIEKGIIPYEKGQYDSATTSIVFQSLAVLSNTAAGVIYLIPEVSTIGPESGGIHLGNSLSSFSSALGGASGIASTAGQLYGLASTFERRNQEWKFQKDNADNEKKPLIKQQIAAEIKKAIAEKDLEIHQKNIEQSKELEEFYMSKFTGLGLYSYLSNELNQLYSTAYKLAFELAQMAQTSYKFEIGEDDFLKFDNWKSDKAGLLAGEKLMLQLEHLEKAYFEKNVRQYEITQSFSLQQISPEQLLEFRQNGKCDFIVPEAAFDLIYPGHYKRIIKSVRVSIPCIVGPYANVGCTISLKESKIRTEPKSDVGVKNSATRKGVNRVATSSAQNDSGMFEFNFRDERYLPFEGAGAVDSEWSIQLPSTFRTFDYKTISDIIFHISYTAKEDLLFRNEVETGLKVALNSLSNNNTLALGINMRSEMPNEWYVLKNTGTVTTVIKKERLPFFAQINSVSIKDEPKFIPNKEDIAIDVDDDIEFNRDFTVTVGEEDRSELEDLMIIVNYNL